MPIYVYKCLTCGESFEEIQKVGEDPPAMPSGSDADGCPRATGRAASPCKLERQLTTAGHRFTAELSSDGLGGYQRQGEVMIKQRPGKDGNFYGTDRAGRR